MPTITYKGVRIDLTQRMFEMLEWAVKYPRAHAWHEIGTGTADAEAAERLLKAGLIEVRDFSNQYRLVP